MHTMEMTSKNGFWCSALSPGGAWTFLWPIRPWLWT